MKNIWVIPPASFISRAIKTSSYPRNLLALTYLKVLKVYRTAIHSSRFSMIKHTPPSSTASKRVKNAQKWKNTAYCPLPLMKYVGHEGFHNWSTLWPELKKKCKSVHLKEVEDRLAFVSYTAIYSTIDYYYRM